MCSPNLQVLAMTSSTKDPPNKSTRALIATGGVLLSRGLVIARLLLFQLSLRPGHNQFAVRLRTNSQAREDPNKWVQNGATLCGNPHD